MISPADAVAVFAIAGACVVYFSHRARPARGAQPTGQEQAMPVSKDVQDFCAGLGSAVQSYAAAQVDAALAGAAEQAKADQEAAVTAAVAQVQQDHADEMAALQAALTAATTTSTGAG